MSGYRVPSLDPKGIWNGWPLGGHTRRNSLSNMCWNFNLGCTHWTKIKGHSSGIECFAGHLFTFQICSKHNPLQHQTLVPKTGALNKHLSGSWLSYNTQRVHHLCLPTKIISLMEMKQRYTDYFIAQYLLVLLAFAISFLHPLLITPSHQW